MTMNTLVRQRQDILILLTLRTAGGNNRNTNDTVSQTGCGNFYLQSQVTVSGKCASHDAEP